MFYLKYRPQKFSELIGLEPIAKTLKEAVGSGQVAHAYLFSGPKGTGKTTAARILAKAVNCQAVRQLGSETARQSKNKKAAKLTNRQADQLRTEPCGKCDSCQAIQEGRYLDLIEIDAASHRGIDDVRDLREKIKLAPTRGKYKVYVIDEAHMLTREAFNALLKTLEEPPKHAIFVLCTTEPHRVPETIRSRCQRFEFKRASISDIVQKLRMICKAEDKSPKEVDLQLIAKSAKGGFRDAETLLEEVLVGGVTVSELLGQVKAQDVSDFVNFLVGGDSQKAIALVNAIFEGGGDLSVFAQNLLEYLRDLLLIKAGVGEGLVERVEEEYQAMEKQAERLSGEQVGQLIEEFSKAHQELRRATIPQLPLELGIMRLIGQRNSENSESQRVRESESQISPEGQGSGTSGLSGSPILRRSDFSDSSDSLSRSEFSDLSRSWSVVLEKIKPLNHSVGALLKSARPKKFDGQNLTLEVFYKFHKEQLELSKNRNLVEKVVAEVLGLPVRLKCVLGRKPTKPKNPVDVFNGELMVE